MNKETYEYIIQILYKENKDNALWRSLYEDDVKRLEKEIEELKKEHAEEIAELKASYSTELPFDTED